MKDFYSSIEKELNAYGINVLRDENVIELDNTGQRFELQFRGTLLNPEAVSVVKREIPQWVPAEGMSCYVTSTPTGREMMRQLGHAYLCQDGNCFVNDRQTNTYVLIEKTGSKGRSVGTPGDYTKNELKILFAWITLSPRRFAGSQSELANYANVSEATVSRALDKLKANGYPRVRDEMSLEQTATLIKTWSEQYLTRLKPKLKKKRFTAAELPDDWKDLPFLTKFNLKYSGVASAAVDKYDIVADEQVEVYAPIETLNDARLELRWSHDPSGRVVVYEQFWSKDLDEKISLFNPYDHQEIPLLTYADLRAVRSARALSTAEKVFEFCLKHYGPI